MNKSIESNKKATAVNTTATVNLDMMIEQVSPKLHGLAFRLTQNINDAKDLYQDTILKITRNIDKFNQGTNAKAWSYTIMKNLFINGYRRRQRKSTIFDTTDNNYYINSGSQSVMNDGERSVMMDEIKKEIDKLPSDLSIPFMMHYRGFKYQEIANELDMPLGTIKSKIFHARKQLQHALKHLRIS